MKNILILFILFLFASCSIQNNQVNTETINSDNQKISTKIKKQSVDVKKEIEVEDLENNISYEIVSEKRKMLNSIGYYPIKVIYLNKN
jgi:cytochrome c oxidase assembly protein Cox11